MDCLILTSVLVLLLTVALQNVSGFTITDHTKNNKRLIPESVLDDDDYAREIRRDLQYIHTLRDAWSSFKDYLTEPQDPNIFESITSYGHTPSLPVDDTIKDIPDTHDATARDIDDIDTISKITYPVTANSSPDLDDVLSPVKLNQFGVPTKRQQGWYVQYGKRTSQVDDKPKLFKDPANYDFLKTNILPKVSTSTKSTEKQKLPSGETGEWKGFQTRGSILELLRRTLLYNKNTGIANDREHAQEIQDPIVWKRQQGWFTQYGKRSKDDLFS